MVVHLLRVSLCEDHFQGVDSCSVILPGHGYPPFLLARCQHCLFAQIPWVGPKRPFEQIGLLLTQRDMEQIFALYPFKRGRGLQKARLEQARLICRDSQKLVV